MNGDDAWITGALTLGGVLLGSIGTYPLERSIACRGEVLAARVTLAEATQWVWTNDWIRLEANLAQLAARLRTLGVPQLHIAEISRTAIDCLAEYRERRRARHTRGGDRYVNGEAPSIRRGD